MAVRVWEVERYEGMKVLEGEEERLEDSRMSHETEVQILEWDNVVLPEDIVDHKDTVVLVDTVLVGDQLDRVSPTCMPFQVAAVAENVEVAVVVAVETGEGVEEVMGREVHGLGVVGMRAGLGVWFVYR